jgi:hypothetical protein
MRAAYLAYGMRDTRALSGSTTGVLDARNTAQTHRYTVTATRRCFDFFSESDAETEWLQPQPKETAHKGGRGAWHAVPAYGHSKCEWAPVA